MVPLPRLSFLSSQQGSEASTPIFDPIMNPAALLPSGTHFASYFQTSVRRSQSKKEKAFVRSTNATLSPLQPSFADSVAAASIHECGANPEVATAILTR